MLTDTAKQDFLKWLNEQEVAPYDAMFDELPLNVKSFYIIEWINSLQIKEYSIFEYSFKELFNRKENNVSFFEVVNDAIQFCNNYYNKCH